MTSSHRAMNINKEDQRERKFGTNFFHQGTTKTTSCFSQDLPGQRRAERLTCVPALYAEIFVNRGYPFQTLEHVITRDKTNPSRDLSQDPGTSQEPL